MGLNFGAPKMLTDEDVPQAFGASTVPEMAENMKQATAVLRRRNDPLVLPLVFSSDETYLWQKCDVEDMGGTMKRIDLRWSGNTEENKTYAPIDDPSTLKDAAIFTHVTNAKRCDWWDTQSISPLPFSRTSCSSSWCTLHHLALREAAGKNAASYVCLGSSASPYNFCPTLRLYHTQIKISSISLDTKYMHQLILRR